MPKVAEHIGLFLGASLEIPVDVYKPIKRIHHSKWESDIEGDFI